MSMQSHLAELERKHQALETELADALAHPSVDDVTIAELKRRKLQVKDEIARLKHDARHERTLAAAIHRRRGPAAEWRRVYFPRSRRLSERGRRFRFWQCCA